MRSGACSYLGRSRNRYKIFSICKYDVAVRSLYGNGLGAAGILIVASQSIVFQLVLAVFPCGGRACCEIFANRTLHCVTQECLPLFLTAINNLNASTLLLCVKEVHLNRIFRIRYLADDLRQSVRQGVAV